MLWFTFSFLKDEKFSKVAAKKMADSRAVAAKKAGINEPSLSGILAICTKDSSKLVEAVTSWCLSSSDVESRKLGELLVLLNAKNSREQGCADVWKSIHASANFINFYQS